MTGDRITISDLRVSTRVGVTDEERSEPQTVLVDLELFVDLHAAGTSDDLRDTVDYDRVATGVAELVRSSETNLLEALAESIARHVCTFTRVERVTVGVAKASPPVEEDVGPIAVRITRP
ncbi:MAG: dihydroneopterin aldolase [Actinobacteria bacterium]|nr:dihydroneopterin aldolase [Actinomycetota bacterium]